MIIVAVSTKQDNLRAEIFGWTYEDSDLFIPGEPIGYTPGYRGRQSHKTVLEMIADGYKLLGPPQKIGAEWDWWLTKES